MSILYCWLVLSSPFSLSLQNWSLYSQHTFKLVEGNDFSFLQNAKKCLEEPSLLRGIKGVKQEDPSYESSWKSTLTLEDRFLTLNWSTYVKFRQLLWMWQWKFSFLSSCFFSMIIFVEKLIHHNIWLSSCEGEIILYFHNLWSSFLILSCNPHGDHITNFGSVPRKLTIVQRFLNIQQWNINSKSFTQWMQAVSSCSEPCCPKRVHCSPGSENTTYKKKMYWSD